MQCQFLLYDIMNQPYVYIYPLHPEPPLPYSSCLGHCKAPCAVLQLPTGYLFFAWQCIYVNATLSICFYFSFPPCVHESVLYVCASIPALQIDSSVPFFQISYICVNIHYLFFSFLLMSLCMKEYRSTHISTKDSISFLFVAE